jgi:uncharacterized DUF497 family protein
MRDTLIFAGMSTPLQFEWDVDKAATNFIAHKVAFDFAVAVFFDPKSVDLDTTREKEGEARRKIIGRVGRRLYAVIYTLRYDGAVHRLISARRTNAREESAYGYRS